MDSTQEYGQIYSENIFLSLGISSLLDKISKTEPGLKSKDYHFLLLSNLSLLNIAQFCHDLDPKKSYVVIGNTAAGAMLSGTGLVIEKFINTSMPINDIEYELLMLLKGIRTHEFVPIPTKWAILTTRERIVLKYITLGMTPSLIARMVGLNIKTISSQKRSIMRKFRVSSNQQLLVKSTLYSAWHARQN
ncbi:helix-turn-helix transcriptional regulator [Hafnia paralvei]|uniref:Helix-turn-helix transcriptional regulator n=1 Tax=Hafnia paralvei TaxID=546367 RepID=A0A4Q9EJD3_9GAMM|nr:helix-turn-helix domain-containing protein [Hafnia paralvei]TBM25847.1 helix-turn-helix transcriptional regulator [Hafnia paralvei]